MVSLSLVHVIAENLLKLHYELVKLMRWILEPSYIQGLGPLRLFGHNDCCLLTAANKKLQTGGAEIFLNIQPTKDISCYINN